MYLKSKIILIFVVALAGFTWQLPALVYPSTAIHITAKNMKEIFLPVKGYEGLYEVSNLGRVKALATKGATGKSNKDKIKVNDVGKKS